MGRALAGGRKAAAGAAPAPVTRVQLMRRAAGLIARIKIKPRARAQQIKRVGFKRVRQGGNQLMRSKRAHQPIVAQSVLTADPA